MNDNPGRSSEPNLPKYRYRVDVDDVLVWVDSWWLAFARENGASDLTEQRVLGRRLWEFIAHEETRRLYQEIHRRVRATARRVVLPFRCDSPTLRRYMQLTITTDGNGNLSYSSVLLRAEPQPILPLLDRESWRSESFLTMCSCCKRALLEPTGWMDVEDVSVRLRLFEQERSPRLKYAICPECSDSLNLAAGNGNVA